MWRVSDSARQNSLIRPCSIEQGLFLAVSFLFLQSGEAMFYEDETGNEGAGTKTRRARMETRYQLR